MIPPLPPQWERYRKSWLIRRTGGSGEKTPASDILASGSVGRACGQRPHSARASGNVVRRAVARVSATVREGALVVAGLPGGLLATPAPPRPRKLFGKFCKSFVRVFCKKFGSAAHPGDERNDSVDPNNCFVNVTRRRALPPPHPIRRTGHPLMCRQALDMLGARCYYVA